MTGTVSRCSAFAKTPGRTCTRKAKYAFISPDRTEVRCGAHAYEWLGSSASKPPWVVRVEVLPR